MAIFRIAFAPFLENVTRYPSKDFCAAILCRLTSSSFASPNFPLAVKASPRAKCHTPVQKRLSSGGRGSLRIESHSPNRVYAKSGATRN